VSYNDHLRDNRTRLSDAVPRMEAAFDRSIESILTESQR
jgi:hypothetical protein